MHTQGNTTKMATAYVADTWKHWVVEEWLPKTLIIDFISRSSDED